MGPEERMRGSLALPISAAAFLLGVLAILLASLGSAAPTVSIVSPPEGADIDSGTVVLVLDIQNFTLNGSAFGLAAVPGEGHYHLFIDGEYKKAAFGLPAFLADVPAGTHEIGVHLANNDHTLIGVNASVNVTVTPGAPRLRIVSPPASPAWASSSVELRIAKGNFTFNAQAVGGPAVPGEGHYHVFVNGAYTGFGTAEFFNLTGLVPRGRFDIRVELAQNDHTLVLPPVFDEVAIVTAAGAPEFRLQASLKGAQVDASSLRAAFTLANFTLDPGAIGQAAVAGEGHYLVFLDGTLLGPGTANPVVLTDLAPGSHTVVLELVENDGTPLGPRVVDWATFTVEANSPRITITSPSDPSSPNSSSLRLTLEVGNLTLSPGKIGQAAVAGEGHWHLLVDDVYVTAGAGLEVSVLDLAQGPHVLTVELRRNDHGALAWPAFDTLRLDVLAGAPSVRIAAPASPVTVNSSSAALSLVVSNFSLSAAKVGAAPADGEGHWHILIDGAYTGFGATLEALASRLPPGTHTVAVELRNNDHSALAWPAFDEVQVTVRPGAPGLSIGSPASGIDIAFDFAGLSIAVSNFSLVPKFGQGAQAGEGHVHVFLDGAYLFFSANTSVTLRGLTAGPHTVRVELRQNNHDPLPDPVADEVAFTARGLAPSIAIVAPSDGAILLGNTTQVIVSITNFTLAPASIGAAPRSGEGHFHILVDGVYAAASGELNSTLAGLAAGDHVLKVELRNNDHTDLGAEVSAFVLIHVADRPSVRVTTPTSGFETTERAVAFTVEVVNLTLAPVNATSTNVAGHGHLHVFVDGNLTQMVATKTFTVANLAVGTHTVRVALAHNDHTAMGGENTSVEVTVTVREPQAPPRGFLPAFGALEALAAVGAAVAALALRRPRSRA